jgi:hypothetical protein
LLVRSASVPNFKLVSIFLLATEYQKFGASQRASPATGR